MPKSSWAPPKASWRKCERGRGNIKADGAGAEVFVGDGCSQGASFGPMVAISRRGQGGRIYNNTRARVLLRRKCVNPRRPHKTFPAKSLRPPPHSDTLFPSIFSLPSRALPLPHAAPTHTRRLRHAFPAEDLRSPPLFRFGHKKNGTAQWMCDAFPADLTTHSPSKTFARPRQRHALPEYFLTPCPRTSAPPPRTDAFLAEGLRPPPHSDAPFPCPPATSPQPRRTPAGCAMHSSPTPQHIPHRRPSPALAAPRSLPFRSASGTKKRHRTVDVRCRMSRSTVVAVGHWGW